MWAAEKGTEKSLSTILIAEVSDLPCSILIDILGRLPLRSLIDCRLYSHHMPTTLILQVKGNSLESLKEICFIEQDDHSLTRKMRLLSNSNKPKSDLSYSGLLPSNFRFQLGNGCNGLVCLREIRTREPCLIWNPVLGQFVILPKPTSTTIDKVVAGFGFCGRTNRYKVLRVFRSTIDPPWKKRAEIYVLGVGTKWREIGDVPFPIPSRIPGFFTNNSLHWILEYSNITNGNGDNYDDINNETLYGIGNSTKSYSELICGFDFVEENFKTIPSPPIFTLEQKDKYHWSNLGIIGNCLSISAIDAKVFRPDVQVWVMEEYGVPESWAMRLSIRDPTVDWWDPYRWIQVTNFVRNGEILLLCAHCYVLAYNLRERRFRSIEGLDFPVIAHVPSFISLEDVLTKHRGTGSLNVRYL
ncbi:F-box protein At3g07870-like [Amaranthus tricolor]|uniref:F-box protein At3g07870-like n=1 Tax=Amaranthus tricolor TaxID=29722 RepID=UPI00258744E5|nr:F-box protein At3g07870-like [Amaranthus tricolor]